ncbi:NAD(P)/FAD-dependent oxidoreductase, partial [Marinobacter sp. SBS5]
MPGIAPAAMQMGRHAARVIRARIDSPHAPGAAFVYRDKGMLATIGRARAVGVIGSLRLRGFVAWALWVGIHIAFLITA